jgi:hypothetical protein
MKLITITVCFLLFATSFPTFAQMGMGKPEDIAEMKKRTLIVLLQQESFKVIEKLNKKGHGDQVPVYKKTIEQFNESLKSAFTSSWPYEQKIEFKEPGEVLAITKSNSKEYAIVSVWQREMKQGGEYNYTTYTNHLDWNYKSIVKGDYDESDKNFFDKVTYMTVALSEKVNKAPVAMVGLSNIFPTKADLVAGIYGVKYYMDYRQSDKGAMEALKDAKKISPELKTKTLLFRQSDLAKNFTKADLKALYKTKFDVVADTIVDKHVIDKTPGYAFIVTVPSPGETAIFSQAIYDCENGDYLGGVIPSIGSAMASGYTGNLAGGGRAQIDKKIVGKLVDAMNDK